MRFLKISPFIVNLQILAMDLIVLQKKLKIHRNILIPIYKPKKDEKTGLIKQV